MLFKNFKAQKFSMGFFGGVKLWSRDFFGFVGIARDFFGFGFLPPFEHPYHLKCGVSSWEYAFHIKQNSFENQSVLTTNMVGSCMEECVRCW